MASKYLGFDNLTEPPIDDGEDAGLEDNDTDYDALNDETFGTEAVQGDWEEDHEKFADIKEGRKPSIENDISYPLIEDSGDEYSQNERSLEDSISRLILEDLDDNMEEIRKPKMEKRSSIPSDLLLESQTLYSSSAPSQSSVWMGFQNGQFPAIPLPIPNKGSQVPSLSCTVNVSGVRTVEEIERDLLARPPLKSQQPISKPVSVSPGKPHFRPLSIEDLGRDLARSLPDNLRHPPGVIPIIPLPGHPMRHMHHPMGIQGFPFDLPHILADPFNKERRAMMNHQNFRNYDNKQQRNYNFNHTNNFRVLGSVYVNSNRRQQRDEVNQDYDEYAGLMGNREKHFLINIQLLQLQSDQPYISDYYYMAYMARQRQEKSKSKENEHMKSVLPDRVKTESRTYSPAQFENSLGKLIVTSVTAPRKIMDLNVSVTEDRCEHLSPPQKESRRYKHLLIEIEKSFLLLLKIDDTYHKADFLPVTEPAMLMLKKEEFKSEREQLTMELAATLLSEEKLFSFMCVRKGKNLLLRVLPLLTHSHQEVVISIILRNLAVLSKLDRSDQILLRFYPKLKPVIELTEFDVLACYGKCLQESSKERGNMKSNMSILISSKFGMSILQLLLCRAKQLYPESTNNLINQEWMTFINNVTDATSHIDLPSPIEPLPEALEHFEQLNISQNKYETLRKAIIVAQ